MFVQVPGGTRAEAWRIGREIADAVTADNPSPVALKLEKVYQPCILQTKKRYVGYMYESPEQLVPIYEAKGIETVRRDGCPAGVALLRSSLCTLFDTGDLSLVKSAAVHILSRLGAGTLPPPRLFLTREYRGAHQYRAGGAAPPMEIANRLLARDRRAAPRVGERVTWLVTSGAPGLPLVKLARTPEELRKDPTLRPHIAYYATRVLLPPLHRCLSLLGVNVFKWWSELGYGREAQLQAAPAGGISRYLGRRRCARCGARAQVDGAGPPAVRALRRPGAGQKQTLCRSSRAHCRWSELGRRRCARCGARAQNNKNANEYISLQYSLCAGCASRPQQPVAALHTRLNVASTHAQQCAQICASCCGHPADDRCVNTHCPVLWRRVAARGELTQSTDVVGELPHPLCREELQF
ncbi:hypothetical protein JYU34_006370 [Plutella xylostella]|uniref:DNA-directed DNA polymerase n=1 Tax=Plutella xylostella TaxID=51655 RepID=A0ABQ7QRU1_PLUXY|nr:hypothetical protein JYU34_006370 [Plutella xylostella]